MEGEELSEIVGEGRGEAERRGGEGVERSGVRKVLVEEEWGGGAGYGTGYEVKCVLGRDVGKGVSGKG